MAPCYQYLILYLIIGGFESELYYIVAFFSIISCDMHPYSPIGAQDEPSMKTHRSFTIGAD